MGWLSAVDGYEVALVGGPVGGRVTSRRVGGRPLKTVPKAVRDHDTTQGLIQTQEWLARHDLACRAEVEKWLIRSLPVPVAALTAVWSDPSWRAPLADVIVAPVDDDGTWQLDDAGFLRDADPARGLGVVNLDGDSVWLTPSRVALPHPVMLEDLDDLREFATELGLSQGTPQLHREVWAKPAGKDAREAELARYSGAKYEELRHLSARASTLGYKVRGGSAVCQVWERGGQTVASVWIGDYDPWSEAETGQLEFTSAAGGALPIDDVGPVAWSEGMRMAAALYAGRSMTEERS